jgi:hypothetical protein
MPARDTQNFPVEKRPRRRKVNQGEGNRDADAAYRAGVRTFIDEGRVAPAAAKSVEAAGIPLPSWWTEHQEDAWRRGADRLTKTNTAGVILGEDAVHAALRYGVGAASFYRDCPEWSDRLAHLLREEWLELGTGIDWHQALPFVREGWEWGHEDLELSDHATS